MFRKFLAEAVASNFFNRKRRKQLTKRFEFFIATLVRSSEKEAKIIAKDLAMF